ARERIADVLSERVPGADLRPHLYERVGDAAILHIFRVASSLDSLVVGEPQILGQVKEAFETANEAQTVGVLIGKALHRAFFVAKRVRTETSLGAGQVSVASVAVDLAKRLYDDLAGHEILLLGAGEIAESAARALQAAGASKLIIANRSFDKAESLARAIDPSQAFASPRSLAELPTLLEHADVVLVSTGSPTFVVTREVAAAAVKRRRGKPLFFVDLAVPRNVDPKVHDLDNCYRYDIDDLEEIVASGMQSRRAGADAAEAIVAAEAKAFDAWTRQLEVTPTIVALREKVRTTLAHELERSLSGKLRHLNEDDRKALGAMLDAAVNKLLHAPTRALKSSVDESAGPVLLEAAVRLFDLPSAGGTTVPPGTTAASVDDPRATRH
ncbi:MAG: glutamyl-tRNA reductase, partial [Polyangiales bacterium]